MFTTSHLCVTAAGLRARNSRNTSVWAGVGLARYASGRYGDQVHYSDGILFLFGRAHALATPKGGGPCPLGTLYYLVVGHLDSRLR